MQTIKAVLFDLDGTLLPMDQDVFVRAYFGLLAKKLAPRGYDSEKLIGAIWGGTAAMVKNDGSATNETVFWDFFSAVFGERCRDDEPVFDEYYRNEFQAVQASCGYDKRAAEVISLLKSKGIRMALATNPIFPAVATESRIRWAGLDRNDFELVTTYENSRHCKPNPDYYRDVLNAMNLLPEDCIMVGNDVGEDMIAATLGMQVFLLTDCIINKKSADITAYPRGNFDDLLAFLRDKTGDV